MEIINPDNLPGNNARGCTTDALAPNNECYNSSGSGGCTAYAPGPCTTRVKP